MAMSVVFTALGETEKAFEWLEKSYAGRSISFPGIKADPHFADLLRRMNLQLSFALV
jgi:hypothetical protein